MEVKHELTLSFTRPLEASELQEITDRLYSLLFRAAESGSLTPAGAELEDYDLSRTDHSA